MPSAFNQLVGGEPRKQSMVQYEKYCKREIHSVIWDLGDRSEQFCEKKRWKTSEKRHQLAGVLKEKLVFAGGRKVILQVGEMAWAAAPSCKTLTDFGKFLFS